MWLAGALVAAVHLLIAVTHGGPVAVPDVPAYLSVSQWLAGVGQSTAGLQFHPGYGWLLAPVAVITQTNGQALHTAALVLNSVAAGLVVIVAVKLAQLCMRTARTQIPRANKVALIAVAVLAALHPSVSVASRVGWPETLLVLLTLSIGLCIAAADNAAPGSAVAADGAAAPGSTVAAESTVARQNWLLAAAALLSGLAFSLHPRALVLSLALCVALLAKRRSRSAWLSVTVGLVAGWACSIAAIAITDTWPSSRLGAAATLENGADPLVTTVGQLIALAAGTVGLALAGLGIGGWFAAAAVRDQLKRDRFQRQPDSATQPLAITQPVAITQPLASVAIFFSSGAVAVMVLGGWVLAGSTRADTFLYGRYVDPWAVALAIVAICMMSTSVRNLNLTRTAVGSAISLPAIAGLAVAGLVVAGLVVLVGSTQVTFTPIRRIMTLSLSPLWSVLGHTSVQSLTVAAVLIAVFGVALFAWSHLRTAQIALAVLALFMFAAATVSNHLHLQDVGEIATGQTETAELAQELAAEADVQCLAYADSLPSYARWLYQLQVPQLRHEPVSFSAAETACGPLIVARRSIEQTCPGVELLANESRGAWGLWRLPAGSACLS